MPDLSFRGDLSWSAENFVDLLMYHANTSISTEPGSANINSVVTEAVELIGEGVDAPASGPDFLVGNVETIHYYLASFGPRVHDPLIINTRFQITGLSFDATTLFELLDRPYDIIARGVLQSDVLYRVLNEGPWIATGSDDFDDTAEPSAEFRFDGNDKLIGLGGDDTLDGGDGSDTLNGGEGDDQLVGGTSEDDLRDVIYAGAGADHADGGFGNDLIYGGTGNDTILGGAGVDELIGQAGDDVITGSAFSDLVFGGEGDDFVNGGFGHDRINGGAGADKFFHSGELGHGSDWVQDYAASEGDALLFGNSSASLSDFQVNLAHTESPDGERAGNDDVREAFVIYKPTGQIIWALVDGEGQSSINLQLGGETFDLLA